MEITYSADAVDLDRPAYDAQAERPDRPIRLRVQPTLLRVRQGETVGNHRSWTGVSWTLECATAEEAILDALMATVRGETGYQDVGWERADDDGNAPDARFQFSEELHEAHNYVVLYFDNELDWNRAREVLGIRTVDALTSRPGFERKGVGRVIRGAPVIARMREA